MAKSKKNADAQLAPSEKAKETPSSGTLKITYGACYFVAFYFREPEESDADPSELKFDVQHEAEVSEENSGIQVTIEFNLYSGERAPDSTCLHVRHRSRFIVRGMERLKTDEHGNKMFSVGFTRTLLALAYSTARGALAERLNATWLESRVLPIISATQLLPEQLQKAEMPTGYPV
jgi:hypothetical protein